MLFMLIMPGNKGFNLFTAMVSLLLISVALILVFNMIKTEDTYLTMIEDKSSAADLIATADIVRADAYDLFVVSLREKWESYKSIESNPFYISRDLVDMSWDSFVQTMGNEEFFGHGFTTYFAEALINKLKYTMDPVGYKVEISNDGDLQDENGFADIVDSMFAEGGYKLDVVGCGTDDNDCIGSFYLTLDARGLSDANFEKLPKVTVLRYKNNEAIERPVLGRQIYRIYMPWRGFQAFRTARRIAHGELVERSCDPAFYKDCPGNGVLYDTGLFNPEIHNTLEQARLGICDKTSCGARTDFFATASSNGFERRCNLGNDADLSIAVTNPNRNIDGTVISLTGANGNYLLHSLGADQKALLEEIAENTVKSNLSSPARNSEKLTYGNGLEMTGASYGNQIKINSIQIDSEGRRSKATASPLSTEGPEIGPLSSIVFNLSAGVSTLNQAGGIGLFMQENQVLRAFQIDQNWNNFENSYSPGNDLAQANLQCYELSEIRLKLKFKETDNRYKVMDDNDVYIYVDLIDSYNTFKFTPNPETIGVEGNYGYLTTGSTISQAVNDTEWSCTSYEINNRCLPG